MEKQPDRENKTTVLKKRQTPDGGSRSDPQEHIRRAISRPDATRRTERIEKKKEGNVGRAGAERRNGDNRDHTQRTPAESEKERHGPAGPRREGGRVNANAQPQSTRTCSSLCLECTNNSPTPYTALCTEMI